MGWIELSAGDPARNRKQVWSAKSHLAGAQLSFPGTRQASGRGERIGRGKLSRRGQRLAEPFTQQPDDLLDLDNLLGGRKNEGSETFPWVLAQEPQPAAGFHRRAHRFIVRKSEHELSEIHIELQVINQP